MVCALLGPAPVNAQMPDFEIRDLARRQYEARYSSMLPTSSIVRLPVSLDDLALTETALSSGRLRVVRVMPVNTSHPGSLLVGQFAGGLIRLGGFEEVDLTLANSLLGPMEAGTQGTATRSQYLARLADPNGGVNFRSVGVLAHGTPSGLECTADLLGENQDTVITVDGETIAKVTAVSAASALDGGFDFLVFVFRYSSDGALLAWVRNAIPHEPCPP